MGDDQREMRTESVRVLVLETVQFYTAFCKGDASRDDVVTAGLSSLALTMLGILEELEQMNSVMLANAEYIPGEVREK